MKEKALISVKTFSIDALGSLKEAYNLVSKSFFVDEISSIFMVKLQTENREIHSLINARSYDGLTVAFLIQTEHSPLESLNLLKSMEKQIVNGKEKDAEFKLLAHGAFVRMTPELTLPHPELHKNPEDLIPATEVYPHFIHPVLKKELTELSKSLKPKLLGQFYAQGKTLLDNNL
ncbi:MAG: hypothetical protein H6625_13625 [Bdellovibrionaceae bacterium]|nr:hypothetical protein [Pseudobdellovibrionaceae bacterium]